jgi:hypothetical protein
LIASKVFDLARFDPMFTGISLVALAVVCRLLSAEYQIWNLVPVCAIALYAGTRLPRRWAWAVPVAAMILSDFVLDCGTRRPIFELTRWAVYATLAGTTSLGLIADRLKSGRWMVLPGLSLFASTWFFVMTNLATWGEGQLYPLTWSGLVTCFVMAIPFFGNTVVADLMGTGVLFGLGPVFERAATRIWRRRARIEVKVADLSETA